MRLDKFPRNREAGQRHRTVVETVELVERNVGVANELHHAPEIGRLLVAPVKLLLAVAGEDEHRWAIFADMEQRGGAVYRRLQRLDALDAARLEMRDDLPAERDDARETVGVHAIAPEPRLVQREHIHQIAPGGVAGDEDLRRVAAELRDVADGPGDGSRRVVDNLGRRDLRGEAVLDTDDDEAVVHQVARHLTPSTRQPAAVEPDQDGGRGSPLGAGNVQDAHRVGVGADVLRAIVYSPLENVVLRPCREDREQEEKGKEK